MKKTAFIFPLLAAAIISCNNTTSNKAANTQMVDSQSVVTAHVKESTPPPPPVDSATMMKNAMDYMTPGDMQKLLASYTGTWSEDMTFWMDPSKPPIKSTATCEMKMILGGRYQQTASKGVMMGMPFEGLGTMAYDNAKKIFISTWIDNGGTGMAYIEGPYDTATKTATMKGKMVDPATGKDLAIKETMQFIDGKNQLMEMYMVGPDGKESKSMEIKFTKK